MRDIILRDLSRNPEPYHEIVVTIYNNNKEAIENTLQHGIKNGDVNIIVWIDLLSILIESVETFKNANGLLKKRIVVEICLIAVEKSTYLSARDQYTIKSILNLSLPTLIDTLVNLSKKINLSTNIGKFFKKICFCCFDKIPEPTTPIIIPKSYLSDVEEEELRDLDIEITPPPMVETSRSIPKKTEEKSE